MQGVLVSRPEVEQQLCLQRTNSASRAVSGAVGCRLGLEERERHRSFLFASPPLSKTKGMPKKTFMAPKLQDSGYV